MIYLGVGLPVVFMSVLVYKVMGFGKEYDNYQFQEAMKQVTQIQTVEK